MDHVTSVVVSALGPALWKVFEVLLKKGADLALDKGFEPLKELIAGGFDERKDSEALRKNILAALDEVTDDKDVDRYDRLLATLKLTGLDEKTRLALAGAAVEMVQFSPNSISPDLMELIELDGSKRELLARFLFNLRKKLANNTKFEAGIAYANSMDAIGELHGLTDEMIQFGIGLKRLVGLEEALIAERHLTTDDGQALRDYLAEVRHQWEGLMLPLIRKKSGGITSAKLKQVYVPLNLHDVHAEEQARRLQARLKPGKDEKEQEQLQRIGIGELLNRYERFILIGSPGCGKTTLLDRMALAFAEGRAAEDLGWKGKSLFPIFLRLRNFGAYLKQKKDDFPVPCSGSLVAYLENQYRTGKRINLTARFFDLRLAEGDCLVLMDGLDEVSEQRNEVARHMAAFIEQYGTMGNRFGLASRPRGYETIELQLRPLKLAVAEVNPMGLDGICQLMENLLVLIEQDPVIRVTDVKNLIRAITASDELIKIAGTPLFCSALVQVYKYHGATLPQRRVDVFDEIVDLLLGFWRAQQTHLSEAEQLASEDGTGKQYREVKDAVAVKQRRLSHLALTMQVKGLAEIERAEAVAVLAEYLMQRERVNDRGVAETWAENFLENSHERSGLLVEVNPDIFAFLHKGFMEYLAASALVNQSKSLVETVLRFVSDDWWEQVILLAGAHPKLPEDFRAELVDEILNSAHEYALDSDEHIQRLVMAGKLARDMAESLPGPQHEQVENVLHAAAIQAELLPAKRAAAADTLDELGYTPEDLYAFIQLPDSQSWVAKYPVTNLQYQRFLESGCFNEDELWMDFPKYDQDSRIMAGDTWSDEGLKWRREAAEDQTRNIKDGIIFPAYWNDVRFGITRKCAPVVGVTWYEVNAYCKWLTSHWHELEEGSYNKDHFKPGSLRLPAEAEWIAAAGGDQPPDRFPWDEKGKSTPRPKSDEDPVMMEILQRTNVSESKIGRTTPVWMYPQGQSPHKVFDMAGNVWEWQANYYSNGSNMLALRGGSWSSLRSIARVSYKGSYNPHDRHNGRIGFRVVMFFLSS